MDDKEIKNLGVTAMSVVPFATSSGSEPAAPTDAADARQQMLAVKRTLDEASAAVESLQGALAAQHELEQLLKQGRTHLQDLRARLQHAEEERERFRTELVESRTAHQRDVEQLQRQLDEQTAAHAQFAEERANERGTFTRLLNEAESKERDMIQERDGLRQQIEALRDAGLRAQSLAREIIQAHEHGDLPSARTFE
jgi:predicted  nucleic acid-binding Zn-ribbon protein